MTAPNRRWFRFSLRTLFVVVTLLACWLGYEINWIRQRHALLSLDNSGGFTLTVQGIPDGTPAPWSIRLFGETGYGQIIVEEPDRYRDAHQTKRLAEVLFPEAKIQFAVHGVSAFAF